MGVERGGVWPCGGEVAEAVRWQGRRMSTRLKGRRCVAFCWQMLLPEQEW